MHLTSRVVFASALYDLVVTAPLATPWTARRTLAAFAELHVRLSAGGTPPALDDGVPMLLANLLGSIVVVWAVVRMLTPTARLGAADTAGRILFATWMAVAIGSGASHVLTGYLALEVAWALVQGAAVARMLSWPRPATLAS